MTASTATTFPTFETKQGVKTPWNATADRQVTSSLVLALDEAGDSKVLEVTTSHSGGRKAFVTTARVVKRENPATSPGFTVTTFDMFGGTYVTLAPQPVARYSAKALVAAHAVAMVNLEMLYVSENAKVVALFDSESPA